MLSLLIAEIHIKCENQDKAAEMMSSILDPYFPEQNEVGWVQCRLKAHSCLTEAKFSMRFGEAGAVTEKLEEAESALSGYLLAPGDCQLSVLM